MDTNLVSQKCKITLSDPWDLCEAATNWGLLVGVIVRQGVHPADGFSAESEAIILKLESPVYYKTESYKYIQLHPRHKDSTFLNLINNKSGTSCTAVLIQEQQVNSEKPFDLSWWRGGGAFLCDIKSI